MIKPSQTTQTARIAKRIREFRERKHQLKWREICEPGRVTPNGILKDDGMADTGLALKIAYNNHEPERRDVRARLGLKDICTTCRRPYRQKTVKAVVTPSRARTWFQSLPREKQEEALQFLYEQFEGVL